MPDFFEEVAHEFPRLFQHSHPGHHTRQPLPSEQLASPAPPPQQRKATPMSFEDIANDLKGDVSKALELLHGIAEDKLPPILDKVTAASTSPLVEAALTAVHLSPESAQRWADMITLLDQEAASAAEKLASAVDPANTPQATDANGAPAGPVIAGQAQ